MINYDPNRWSSQILAIRGTISPKVFLRVGVVVAWSVCVVALHRYVRHIEIPPTVHALIGVALGLLLVFRTNSSYDRYWEGRKSWARILNESRNIARSSRTLLGGHPALSNAVILWTAAFPYACMHSLRGGRGLGPMVRRLPAAEVEGVLSAPHVPTAVAMRITAPLVENRPAGTFAERAVIAIDGMVRSLLEQIGECERIKNTPLPFAYVVHLRRALVLYLLTLPFALVGSFGWMTILYTLLSAYILMGIDEIGVEIENPFGGDRNDLPLETICETAEKDLLALMIPPMDSSADSPPLDAPA